MYNVIQVLSYSVTQYSLHLLLIVRKLKEKLQGNIKEKLQGNIKEKLQGNKVIMSHRFHHFTSVWFC